MAKTPLETVREVHKDKGYGWDKFVYTNARQKVTVTCPEHGDFEIIYDSLRKGHGCKKCGHKTKRVNRRYTTDEFIELVRTKLLDINGEEYDYSKVVYENRSTKVLVTCKVHGDFLGLPANMLNNNTGCPKCGTTIAHRGMAKPAEQVVDDLSKVLDPEKYWLKDPESYTNNKDRLIFICKEHGEWGSTVNWVLTKEYGCPKCSLAGTSKQELELIDFITKDLGFSSALLNNRTVISPLELDIVIPEKNLAIEYNGLYYHSEQMGKGKDYHIGKTLRCQAEGYQLIHIWEDEWIYHKDKVKNRLAHILGVDKSQHIGARKLDIKEVSFQESSVFFDKYHMQGKSFGSSVAYGLYQGSELLACMSFGMYRFGGEKDNSVELFRYAASCNVAGGFTRLLKRFIKDHPSIQEIISFSDKRWSAGDVYRKNGFSLVSTSAPGYDYADKNLVRRNRQNYMKHKLPSVLAKYDDSLTEYENCSNNGLLRVWNCGMDKWVYTC